jgi:acyl-CoA synthetase (AMP-forming)/AMP-acid ligase II
VLDRLRNTVIRGGCTISPAEVERHIAAHPAIADVACVPVPDPDLSERLCACVARRHGAGPLTLTELQAFLEDERGLERRKLPEHLLTLDQLPLGPTGKVCRSTLARLAATRVADGFTAPGALR